MYQNIKIYLASLIECTGQGYTRLSGIFGLGSLTKTSLFSTLDPCANCAHLLCFFKHLYLVSLTSLFGMKRAAPFTN